MTQITHLQAEVNPFILVEFLQVERRIFGHVDIFNTKNFSINIPFMKLSECMSHSEDGESFEGRTHTR